MKCKINFYPNLKVYFCEFNLNLLVEFSILLFIWLCITYSLFKNSVHCTVACIMKWPQRIFWQTYAAFCARLSHSDVWYSSFLRCVTTLTKVGQILMLKIYFSTAIFSIYLLNVTNCQQYTEAGHNLTSKNTPGL